MSKHTPGPWLIGSKKDQVLAGGGTYRAVATTHTCDGSWGMIPISQNEAEANARLIAAAPEMLEALRSALNLMTNEKFSPFLDAPLLFLRDELKRAIAKAEGREG